MEEERCQVWLVVENVLRIRYLEIRVNSVKSRMGIYVKFVCCYQLFVVGCKEKLFERIYLIVEFIDLYFGFCKFIDGIVFEWQKIRFSVRLMLSVQFFLFYDIFCFYYVCLMIYFQFFSVIKFRQKDFCRGMMIKNWIGRYI